MWLCEHLNLRICSKTDQVPSPSSATMVKFFSKFFSKSKVFPFTLCHHKLRFLWLNGRQNIFHLWKINPKDKWKFLLFVSLYSFFFFFPPFLPLHQSIKMWRPVYERPWCFYSMEIERAADRIVLSFPYAGKSSEGSYRCVSDAENVTAPDNSSQPLAFKVHCECLGWYG